MVARHISARDDDRFKSAIVPPSEAAVGRDQFESAPLASLSSLQIPCLVSVTESVALSDRMPR